MGIRKEVLRRVKEERCTEEGRKEGGRFFRSTLALCRASNAEPGPKIWKWFRFDNYSHLHTYLHVLIQVQGCNQERNNTEVKIQK